MKKILQVIPVILLLATACNSTQSPTKTTSDSTKKLNALYSNPSFGPIVQNLTQAGTYKNNEYNFQVDIPVAYSVQEKKGTPGSTILINGEQDPFMLFWTTPTTTSLQEMIKIDGGDLIKRNTLTDTIIADAPAVNTTNSYGRNWYFLIYNGNYFRIEKANNKSSDDLFDNAVKSLRFTDR